MTTFPPPPPDAPLTARDGLVTIHESRSLIESRLADANRELSAFRAVCRVCGVAGAAELGELLAKLPRTADGVVIVPGMLVFIHELNDDTLKPTGTLLTRKVLSFAQDDQLRDGSLWWVLTVPEFGGLNASHGLQMQDNARNCYSSLAAALASMPQDAGTQEERSGR